MGSNKQDKDLRIKKYIAQVLAEKDENIRQAFEQFNEKVGQGFQGVEFKLAVVFTALEMMGISNEKLQEIANKIQTQAGGEQNEQTKGGTTPEKSGEDNTDIPQFPPSDEKGDEHFG